MVLNEMDHPTTVPTDVGHLLREPVIIDCPACQHRGLSRLREEVVTAPQILSFCLNKLLCGFNVVSWSGRYDYNHYCSECGCFIGRYINFNKYLRKMMRSQRNDVESEYRVQLEAQQAAGAASGAHYKNGTNIGPAATTPLAPTAQK